MANGDLLLKDPYAPFARIPACGERRRADARAFHPSIGPDANGDISAPADMREPGRPPVRNRPKDCPDDTTVHMTADGRMIEKFNMTGIPLSDGYRQLLIGMASSRSSTMTWVASPRLSVRARRPKPRAGP
ncbi:MAG TPA: hypothetical protein PLI43_04955 [Albidovulum sp.]|uniref:hypothetical protein n=1 Tax=Albidovulum sp. TaxID=1872424 RepID=UPI002B70F65E|nr:hypothetical protein [Albidovulum sp.]